VRVARVSAIALLAAAGAAGVGIATTSRSADATPDTRGITGRDARDIRASEDWTRLSRLPVPSLRSLGDAHQGVRRTWVNRTRAQLSRNGRQRFPYPKGTTVVKSGTQSGAVIIWAIMRKVSAGNGIGTWQYVEYKRSNGRQPFSKLQVSQSLCSGCHQQATSVQKSDYVFTRLP
jgi:hypothetical protein